MTVGNGNVTEHRLAELERDREDDHKEIGKLREGLSQVKVMCAVLIALNGVQIGQGNTPMVVSLLDSVSRLFS